MKSTLFLCAFLIVTTVVAQEQVPQDSITSNNPIPPQDSTAIGNESSAAFQQSAPTDTLTIETIDEHSPGLASLYSAVLPGLGQAYNKSYWKIPVVYGALFTVGYLIYDSNAKYQFVRRNLIAATDNDPETINYTGRSAENLTSNQDRLRRSRDFNMILLFIVYLLNVADAHIDAHLIDFNANPDINAFVDPAILPNPDNTMSLGLSFTMKF